MKAKQIKEKYGEKFISYTRTEHFIELSCYKVYGDVIWQNSIEVNTIYQEANETDDGAGEREQSFTVSVVQSDNLFTEGLTILRWAYFSEPVRQDIEELFKFAVNFRKHTKDPQYKAALFVLLDNTTMRIEEVCSIFMEDLGQSALDLFDDDLAHFADYDEDDDDDDEEW